LTAVVARSRSVLALCALLASFWLADSAAAQSREFVGKVVTANPQSLAVKDRRANIVSFTRSEKTQIEGKGSWDEIGVGDRVLVRWKLGDGTASRVIVLESAPAR
jgi:hypothetical protein